MPCSDLDPESGNVLQQASMDLSKPRTTPTAQDRRSVLARLVTMSRSMDREAHVEADVGPEWGHTMLEQIQVGTQRGLGAAGGAPAAAAGMLKAVAGALRAARGSHALHPKRHFIFLAQKMEAAVPAIIKEFVAAIDGAASRASTGSAHGVEHTEFLSMLSDLKKKVSKLSDLEQRLNRRASELGMEGTAPLPSQGGGGDTGGAATPTETAVS